MIQLSVTTDGRSTSRDASIGVMRWDYENALSSQAHAWVRAGTYEPVTIAWLEEFKLPYARVQERLLKDPDCGAHA